MKKLILLFAVCLMLAACENAPAAPLQTDPAVPTQTSQTSSQAETAPTQETTAPTQAPTEETGAAVTGTQPMALVGSWQRTHSEVEGDRNKNTKATITITGDTEQSLVITYKDKEFPDDNFKNKALTCKQGALYPDCGNDQWFADVASTGSYSYSLTLLPDGALLLQCGFDFDGQTMVSYQWFARSE